MALYPDQLDDFVNLTLSRFKYDSWVDISLTYQQCLFVDRLIQAGRMREKGGPDLRFKVQVRNTGSARPTGLFSVDRTVVRDLTTEGVLPWTAQTANWEYDIAEESFQSSMEQIVDEIAVREHSMWNDFFELMEGYLWTAPASSSDNPRTPSGIPFWLQKYSTATPSFQGGNPSGWTSGAASISSTTYPKFKNWAGKYVDISRADLIAKAREATVKTRFKAVKNFKELSTGAGDDAWEHFTTYRVLGRLEELLEARNDNLGADLSKYMGSVIFRGRPVTYVPYLEENDTSDPWYGVCWNQFFYYVKEGWDMRLAPIKNSPNQHNVRERHLDHWCNFGLYNRRESGFVLSK